MLLANGLSAGPILHLHLHLPKLPWPHPRRQTPPNPLLPRARPRRRPRFPDYRASNLVQRPHRRALLRRAWHPRLYQRPGGYPEAALVARGWESADGGHVWRVASCAEVLA